MPPRKSQFFGSWLFCASTSTALRTILPSAVRTAVSSAALSSLALRRGSIFMLRRGSIVMLRLGSIVMRAPVLLAALGLVLCLAPAAEARGNAKAPGRRALVSSGPSRVRTSSTSRTAIGSSAGVSFTGGSRSGRPG